MGVHGDKVPCTKKDSLDITSMFGLMGKGTTIQMMFFLFSYFAKCQVDDVLLAEFPDCTTETNPVIWEVLVWSFLAPETGLHPFKDHRGEYFTSEPWLSLAGTPLAGGLIGNLWNFRSDADYVYKDLNLPGYWSSGNPCHSCFCDKVAGPTHFLNFGPDATWPNTIFLAMQSFFDFCALKGKPVHALFRPRSQGGLGLHILIMLRDSLHVMDLGTTPLLLGSVLWLLCYGDYICDGDPAAACRKVFSDVDDLYKANKVSTRMGNIELSMFVNPEFPRRGSPYLKAKGAEARHLTPVLALVFARYSKGTAYDRHVLNALNLLTDIYGLIGARTDDGSVPLFLSEAASDVLRETIDHFLIEVSFLESIAIGDELGLFHGVSKHHSLWHMGFESQFAHPSCGRTYVNEDFMQHMRKVGMAQRHAVPSSRRSLTVCERIAVGRSIQLHVGDVAF
jgi:hypothetical protein